MNATQSGGLTPQAYLIYEKLMSGAIINRKSAINDLDVQNLTARISEFRAKGVRFQEAYYYYNPKTGKVKREAQYLMKISDRNYNRRYVA